MTPLPPSPPGQQILSSVIVVEPSPIFDGVAVVTPDNQRAVIEFVKGRQLQISLANNDN